MGSAYSAECECGYQEHDLMDGYGMSMQAYSIVVCLKCKRLSSLFLGKVTDTNETTITNRSCKHCHSGGIGLYEVLPDHNLCPGCGSTSLEFTETMLWD